MSKAIERAIEVFPHKEGESEFMYSATEKLQQLFVIGYKQAEKDLALTGEDIRNISKILHQLEAEDWCSELIFDEAARIFNEQRRK